MTIEQLAETGEFQAMFQMEFEAQFQRHVSAGALVDVGFPEAATFKLTEHGGTHYAGRFRGCVSTSDNRSGETDGTFRLELPRGHDGGTVARILDNAALKVAIERFPVCA